MRPTAAGEWHAVVRLEIIAEVRSIFFAHVFGLWLAALIVFARVEMAAVFATMDVGVAMRAFVCAHDFTDDFNFASAVVTNHNFPLNDGLIKSRMCRISTSRLQLDGSTARKQATRSVTKWNCRQRLFRRINRELKLL